MSVEGHRKGSHEFVTAIRVRFGEYRGVEDGVCG